jgi:DNA polymerase-1
MITTATNLKELEVTAEQMIRHWQKEIGVEEYLIAFSDGKGKYFRHNILEQYKGNRKGTAKPLGYKHLVKYLKKNHLHMELPDCEADDVLGILATDGVYARNIIVSIDKDMLTIPCEYYNMDTKVTEIIDEQLADYMHLYQTLTGDTTDNYKGCPGIGPKTAVLLLKRPTWETVEEAFLTKGLTKEDALVQARVARILRTGEYDFKKEEAILWEP